VLAELLHDLGHIIYYDDDDGLRHIVVLQPECTRSRSCRGGMMTQSRSTSEA
jgi:hypothetical protein